MNKIILCIALAVIVIGAGFLVQQASGQNINVLKIFDMGGKQIVNVGMGATPGSGDAATVGYVDNKAVWEKFGSYIFPFNLGYSVGIGTSDAGSSKLKVVGGPIEAAGGLIIETRYGSDPANPETGRMWLRADLP